MPKFKKTSAKAFGKGVYDHAEQKPVFDRGQVTDKIANTVIYIFISGGIAQILLPPDEGLDVKLNELFHFGQLIEIDDFFDVEDIQISIYENELNIKYFAELKEGVL